MVATAERIAGHLGIDGVIADVLPDDKAARIAGLRSCWSYLGGIGLGTDSAPTRGAIFRKRLFSGQASVRWPCGYPKAAGDSAEPSLWPSCGGSGEVVLWVIRRLAAVVRPGSRRKR